MNDDDDLPVLTQVLRTGTVRSGPGADELDAAGFPSTSVDLLDEHSVPDQLVIGNESWIEPEMAPPLAIEAARPDEQRVVDAPWIDHASDSFRLPQDVDAHSGLRTFGNFGEPELPAPVEPPTPDAVPLDATAHAAPAPAALGGADRVAFEARLRESVLDDLRMRIDTELDARIAQAMHAEVETAIAQLQGRLRTHLSQALQDVVARAVEQEMVRMTVERPGAEPR